MALNRGCFGEPDRLVILRPSPNPHDWRGIDAQIRLEALRMNVAITTNLAFTTTGLDYQLGTRVTGALV